MKISFGKVIPKEIKDPPPSQIKLKIIIDI